MQPFNIEKFRAGEKVITRDGREVKQLTEFDCNSPFPFIGVVGENRESWTKKGRYTMGPDDDNDLFHPEPEMWVNVYIGINKNCPTASGCFYSKSEANKHMFGVMEALSDINYIGTFKLVRNDT